MTVWLDLSQSINDKQANAEAALKAQLAGLVSVPAGRIVLAVSPDDALRADPGLAAALRLDVSQLGVAIGAPTLIRLGPDRAPVTAIILAEAQAAAALSTKLSPPPQVLIEAGLDALRPAARAAARADRAERERILTGLAGLIDGAPSAEGLRIDPARAAALALTCAPDGTLTIPDAATARALAKHLGANASGRRASVRRTTKETDIALSVDLDGEGARVDTGVKFFDHMLEQIARHGGIGLAVRCEGDVEVDAHHTIEDVCLALGEALRAALGDKRGIARFGFETPMDETRAGVWIDLSGRPFARFDGIIPGERVSDFPVEMCAHAFRSLAESMKAAIHVSVDGENAHHMIESCFKAFGRALRMAARIEGDALPSTKGVL
ncbi:MAG: imidazoleglycerol-phosphate dehydratase HisB [Alphaproteobacteria bacterium]|nr:imidazoleglycerol-phosphate dehydratase HisB [Alphaproteobacteria bacterium]